MPLRPLSFYASLAEPKGRKANQCYLLEGPKAVSDALTRDCVVDELILDKSRSAHIAKQYPALAAFAAKRFIEHREFARIADAVTGQGVAAVMPLGEPVVFDRGIIVALNGIQDPGNAGTIIRTACAMGVRQFLLDRKSADPYAPKTVRASAGAVSLASLRRCADLAQEVGALKQKGFMLCTLEQGGTASLAVLRVYSKLILVIGSEGSGVDVVLSRGADARIRIPIAGVESLNAAVAAAIALYELRRS